MIDKIHANIQTRKTPRHADKARNKNPEFAFTTISVRGQKFANGFIPLRRHIQMRQGKTRQGKTRQGKKTR